MSIRKLESLPEAELYYDDYDILSNIEDARSNRISNNTINSGNLSDMREGEIQVDAHNSIGMYKVIKIKGYLYRETVDTDNNVILTKID